MYFFFAILSMLGYSVQAILMVRWYRKMDSLSASTLRGISLGLTMLPLLLFSSSAALIQISNHGAELVLATLLTAFANWAAAACYRHLAVGIAAAFQQGLLIIFLTLIGYFLFGEDLTSVQYIYVILIIVGSGLLNIKKEKEQIQTDSHVLLGFSLCFVFSFLLSLALYLVVKLSRQVDPFLTAYSWEFLSGIFSLLLVYLRSGFGFQKYPHIAWRDIFSILLCSAPTVIGTGFYALAVTSGPIAVIGSILSCGVAMAAVLGFLFYKERLSVFQCLLILLILLSIIGLKLS